MAFRLNRRELDTATNEISGAVEWLRQEVDRLRSEFDERSERWRESERGSYVEEWIGRLDEALTGIENGMTDLEGLEQPES